MTGRAGDLGAGLCPTARPDGAPAGRKRAARGLIEYCGSAVRLSSSFLVRRGRIAAAAAALVAGPLGAAVARAADVDARPAAGAPGADALPAAGGLARPRFEVAIAAGLSWDPSARDPSLPGSPRERQTAYLFVAGLGGGPLGLELRSFANAPQLGQPQRLGGDLLAVVRPFAFTLGDEAASPAWTRRVLRTIALTVGPALEQVAFDMQERWRLGVATGLHVDLPLGPAGRPSELRLRVGGRKMWGKRLAFTPRPVDDTDGELYAGLVVAF
jgi:hypothetical protein